MCLFIVSFSRNHLNFLNECLAKKTRLPVIALKLSSSVKTTHNACMVLMRMLAALHTRFGSPCSISFSSTVKQYECCFLTSHVLRDHTDLEFNILSAVV